jgi:hypothetical protein
MKAWIKTFQHVSHAQEQVSESVSKPSVLAPASILDLRQIVAILGRKAPRGDPRKACRTASGQA